MANFFFIQYFNVELMVEGGDPKGGSVVETLVWMRALNSIGHKVFQARLSDDERIVNDDFNWVNFQKIYDPKKYKKTGVWFSYRLPTTYMALKRSECDYFFTSIPLWVSYFHGLICKSLGIKHIIRIANDKNVNFNMDKNYSKIEKKLIHLAYKNADTILAQNEFQFETLTKKYRNVNIFKLNNPIVLNREFLNPKKEKTGYIAWVANFRYQKNLKLLFEIAQNCPKETFKIAGQRLLSTTDEETFIYVDQLENLPNVEFVGVVSQSDILKFVSKAKFLLSTSRYEGFSNTFLEAMMVGLPIITTNTVNPDGIIDTFELGYIYNNEEDFRKILNSISEHDYLKKSNNCIEYIKKNHDHLELGKKLLKILEN